MDPVSLTVSIFALAKTAAVITNAIQAVSSSDVSTGIENLSTAFKHTFDAVQRLKILAEEPGQFEGKEGLCEEALGVVADTHKTLTELRKRIEKLQPPEKSKGTWRSLQIRTRYQWSERSVQTLLLRLQERRQALSSVSDTFARVQASTIQSHAAAIRVTTDQIRAETTQLRAQIEGINAQFQEAVTRLREAGLPPVTANLAEADDPGTSATQTVPRDSDSDSDSPVDVRTSSHPRDASQSAVSKPSAPAPLLKQKNISLLLKASSGHEMQLARKRYATIKAAEVARGITRQQDQNLRSLVRSLAAAEAATKGLTSPEIASAALALGKAYRDAALYEDALQVYKEALTAREAIFGATNSITLNIWDSIAQVHVIQSRWSDALACYQILLEGRMQDPKAGQGHPSTLTAATKVARMQQQLGHHDEAATQCANVLSAYASQNKSQSLPAFAVRLQIAEIYQAQGKLDEAVIAYTALRDQTRNVKGGERLAEQADAAIRKIQEDKPEPTTETSDEESEPGDRSGMALCTKDAELINTCRRQLEELGAVLGRSHPDTLAKMYELAVAYSSADQHRNAIGWFQEVVTGRTKVFGPDHPLTLDATHQMAASYEELGDLDKAFEHYHTSLSRRETKLGDDHPQTLSSVVAISMVYSARGDNNVARDLLLRAVDGYTRRYSADHSATLSAKYKLAEVYREKALLQRSLELHREVLDRRIATLGPNNAVTLNSERAVGNVYRRMKQFDMAITHLQRVLEGREKTFRRVHSLTISVALDLASIYWNTDRPGNAVVYYQQAFEGIQHQEPDSPTAGLVTMSNIALCYYTLGDYAEALSWYKKMLTIQESEHGLTHEETIYTAEQVARCCMEIEEWVTAIELFQRVIASKQKSLSDSPSEWSFNLFQLALACFKKGMYNESLAWSRRILDLEDKIRPEERLATMRRTAVILSKQAKLEESLETYQKALDECKKSLGDDHWLAESILDEKSELYLQIDGATFVARDYQKTLDELQRTVNKDNYKSLKILYKFADVHLEQHRYQEALNLYTTVLEAVEKSSHRHEAAFTNLCNACISDIATCHMKLFNTHLALSFLDRLICCGDDEYRLGALVRIGNTQEKQGEYVAAIETYKHSWTSRPPKYQDALTWTNRALQGFQALGTDTQAETFETLDFLSSVYCHLGRFQDATRVQKEAMEGFARVRGPQHASTLKATLDLAEMYGALERKEEANQLYQRALSGYEARVKEVRDEGTTELGEEHRVVRELKGKIREISGHGSARY
ncbi:hypothetical protein G647_01218 [Cladophialophora carrionii CBS 160.54]|uniref:Fungal N-terminal domain-containing protein n=1 Tax=Cladophialophora carrionii CBS 160.54 TaxID=1279043 RepID=V9DS40_9EURO|nr:uncharacterized protein G647_01218 [Cladophialophora carrionii CBS 160.54]ETI28767.1 hypothetical protein G647_01218 [Cladophialophora carrionii CBS 160.54]